MNCQTSLKIKQGLALSSLIFLLTSAPISANEAYEEPFKATETVSAISIVPQGLHLSVNAAEALLQHNPDIIPIDLRSEKDFENSRIANAVHLDYFSADFEERLASLDKNATYLIYCESGDLSEQAAQLMTEAGIQQSHILGGGFRKWEASESVIASN